MSKKFRTACACRQGQRNRKCGRECEDYAEVYQDDKYAIIALADGATSADHAKEAARINVRAFIHVFQDDYLWSLQSGTAIKKRLLTEINDKFRETRWALNHLSATLTGVAINKITGEVIILSIGDGTVIALDADHEAYRLVEPFNNGDRNRTYFTNDYDIIVKSDEGNSIKILNLRMPGSIVDSLKNLTGFLIFSDGGNEIFTQHFGKGAEFIRRIAEEVWVNDNNDYIKECTEDISGNYTSDDISIAVVVTDYATDMEVRRDIVINNPVSVDFYDQYENNIDVDISIEEETKDDVMMSFEDYLLNEIRKKPRTVEELRSAGIGDKNAVLSAVIPALKSGKVIFKNGKFCTPDN